MKRRLFIGIVPSETALNEIANAVDSIRNRTNNTVRFVPGNKQHITLVFLGEQDEAVIPLIRKAMESTFETFIHAPITTNHITLAPSHHEPRMLWLTTTSQSSKYLATMHDEIKKELITRGIHWDDEGRTLNAHMTIAKFDPKNAVALGSIASECACRIEEYAVELIESKLSHDGATYTTLLSMARK